MVRTQISELGAPIGFVEPILTLPVLDTPKQAEQSAIEAAARKERDEIEAAIRKWDGVDQSKKVFDAIAEQERKWKEPLEQAKQSDLEAVLRKERDELEATLRGEQQKKKQIEETPIPNYIDKILTQIKQTLLGTATNNRDKLEAELRNEQQKKDIASYGKELQTVLESCGFHTTFTESEYEDIYTSKNRYDKLVGLIQPATKLKSEYLNCSEYYYNKDIDTIFEITTVEPNETLTKVDKKVDVTLRQLNNLPLNTSS